MKQAKYFHDNAENRAWLAERATDEPAIKRYRRMEAAWRSLAGEQAWLDGEVSPIAGGPRGQPGTAAHAEAGGRLHQPVRGGKIGLISSSQHAGWDRRAWSASA